MSANDPTHNIITFCGLNKKKRRVRSGEINQINPKEIVIK